MATIITADNSTTVLAQLAEQQERMAETIEGLVDQLADQTLRTDQHDEQLRTQAMALRSTAAQLARTIADSAKAGPNPNSGNPGSNNRTANSNPGNPGNGVGAKLGGEAELGPLEAEAEVGGRLGARSSPITRNTTTTTRKRFI
jgi:hypothetical protein